MIVKLIVEGGKMQPGPAVAQQLGPMGINLGKVITDVNDATKGFVGIKVPVALDVDAKTKKYKITVSSPPVSELIKKELGAEKGSGTPHDIKVGNISIEQVISVAKTKMPNLLAKTLKSAVKLVIGTCVSAGVLIESKSAKEVMKEIEEGKYDKEIAEERTDVSPDKKKKLAEFFAHLKVEQDRKIKEAEAAKAAEEAAKAVPVEGAAPPAAAEQKAPPADKKAK